MEEYDKHKTASTEHKVGDAVKLLSCGGCKKQKTLEPAKYCSLAYQKADWKDRHKFMCGKDAPELVKGDWMSRYRATRDGTYHHGDLEL
jgi:hypothetical protein